MVKHAKILIRECLSPAVRTSSSIQMTTLFMFFKKQSFPTSNKAELPDAVRREVNNAVKNISEEKRNGASGRK